LSETTEPIDGAVRVVLVRPIRGTNVGAVCRAMKNMGAGALYVVDARFDLDEARRTAVHAADILAARRECSSLRDALQGCSLVVGTTARGGPYRERGADIRAVAAEIAASEANAGELVPALVFGPEDSGLSNDDIACCHRLAFVPTTGEYASLNLAQAVLVCVYEVLRARDARARARQTAEDALTNVAPVRADAAEIEEMYAALERSLVAIGFLSPDTARHIMMSLRDVLGRSGLDERELRILRGIARQISWFAGGGDEVARRKRERGEKLR
jgi:tRNA/rRNA methyltransferase